MINKHNRIHLFIISVLCCISTSAQQLSSLQEQAQAILMQGAHINHFNRL